MKPGDLVRVYSIESVKHLRGQRVWTDVDFILGSLDGGPTDSVFPPGTLACVVELRKDAKLVRDEEVAILLIGGHLGWAYKDECFDPDEKLSEVAVEER